MGGNLHHTVLGILRGKKTTLVGRKHGFRCKRWVTLHHAEERKRDPRLKEMCPARSVRKCCPDLVGQSVRGFLKCNSPKLKVKPLAGDLSFPYFWRRWVE